MMSQGVVQNTADLRHVGHVDIHRIRCYLSLLMYFLSASPIVRHFFLLSLFTVNTLIIDLSHLCSDPVVVPVESEEEKAEHSDPEKEEDIGITFVARKTETPKHRPQSGEFGHVTSQHEAGDLEMWVGAVLFSCDGVLLQFQQLWTGVQAQRLPRPRPWLETATCPGRAVWALLPPVCLWRPPRSSLWTCSRPGTRASPPWRASLPPLHSLSPSTHGSAHCPDW